MDRIKITRALERKMNQVFFDMIHVMAYIIQEIVLDYKDD